MAKARKEGTTPVLHSPDKNEACPPKMASANILQLLDLQQTRTISNKTFFFYVFEMISLCICYNISNFLITKLHKSHFFLSVILQSFRYYVRDTRVISKCVTQFWIILTTLAPLKNFLEQVGNSKRPFSAIL